MGEQTNQKPPETEPQTKGQFAPTGGQVILGGGQLRPVPGGTYATYRRMRANPTVALARTVATLPQRMAEIAFEARDDDVPEPWLEFIRDTVTPLWQSYVNDAVRALDFGWTSWEKLFAVSPEGRLVIKRLKYLIPENTTVQVGEHGTFAGLKQGKVELPPENTLVFAHDKEGDNWYGRSVMENIRTAAWWPWEEISEKQKQYMTKVAGVTAMVHYPPGKSRGPGGREIENSIQAASLLKNLGKSQGIAVPNILVSNADVQLDAALLADIKKLRAWEFDFLEATTSHGSEFDQALRHRESLILRGWMVPERAVTEGQFGTKAEASEHGAIAEAVAMQNFQAIVDTANKWIVNQLLVLNFGPAAKGAVNIVRQGLDPATKTFFRELVKAVFSNPLNSDLFEGLVGLEALLESLGLPKNTDAELIPRPDRPMPDVSDIKAAVGEANAQEDEA